MGDTTYTIRIKKEYASAIIEDLKQVDAIEIVEQPVPEWQKEESIKRLFEMKADPASGMSEGEFFRAIDGEKE
jgi:hypothetical protein